MLNGHMETVLSDIEKKLQSHKDDSVAKYSVLSISLKQQSVCFYSQFNTLNKKGKKQQALC